MPLSYSLFDTPLGACGLVWSSRGLVRVVLPGGRAGEARVRLQSFHPEAEETEPPRWVEREAARLRRHLGGKPQQFGNARIDPDALVNGFFGSVYRALQEVPAGRTVTYSELAALAGSPGASRAVGQAMARNPLPLLVPCHRVLAAGGKPGGFSAAGGVSTKRRLLELEGAVLNGSWPGGLPYDGESAVKDLCRQDPALGRLIERVGPFVLALDSMQSPFQALAESIVYQQLTGKAAATIYARMLALFHPRRTISPDDLTTVPDEKLRSAGLSRAKTAALKDLARKAKEGIVPSRSRLMRMENEDIIEHLTAVRGIGPWTVEMLLIFRLGRPDVLPVTDYGVRKGFARAFRRKELPNAAQLMKRGERWRPWRSVAAWYLWRAAEMRQ